MRNLLPIYYQANHNLICKKSITDKHMTYKSLTSHLIIWFNVKPFHMCQYSVQDFLVHLHTQSTVSVFNNRMGTSCIKSCNDPAIFISAYRKLSFIPVMIRLFHSNDRFHRKVCKSTNSFQMTFQFLFFKSKLLLIGKSLQLTTATLTG